MVDKILHSFSIRFSLHLASSAIHQLLSTTPLELSSCRLSSCQDSQFPPQNLPRRRFRNSLDDDNTRFELLVRRYAFLDEIGDLGL